MNETPKSAKIKCKCGHVNLIPIVETFHGFEPVKCEKCGKVIAEPDFARASFSTILTKVIPYKKIKMYFGFAFSI